MKRAGFGIIAIPRNASDCNPGTSEATKPPDFTELLVAIGKYAQAAETAACFCIDEIQYARNDELEGMIATPL